MGCCRKECPSYTLKKSVSRKGIGLFTGIDATLTLHPLPLGSGVVMLRSDIAGASPFPLSLSHVQGTPRCTIVGDGKVSVQTVEHLLAVLHVFSITDLLIEISGPELPIFDGSSLPFVEMVEEAGLCLCKSQASAYLDTPVYWSSKDMHLIALPSADFTISYTLDYPNSRCIGTQFLSFKVDKEAFIKEIAPSRTFSIYEEVAPLIEKGLLKGGSLDSAIVIKEDKIANPEGLRLPNEMVRHKILDMIGDLYLIGFPFSVHIIAIKSGHYGNNELARKLVNQFKRENT